MGVKRKAPDAAFVFLAGRTGWALHALFPESLEDFIAADNAIHIVDAFVSKLDMRALQADPDFTNATRMLTQIPDATGSTKAD